MRLCDSVYGCEKLADKSIDDWDYCNDHYLSYLIDRQRYKEQTTRRIGKE